MNDPSTKKTVGFISAQIEAASSLIKFASDDLAALIQSNPSIFASEINSIIQSLQQQSAVLDGSAAFLLRTDFVDDTAIENSAGESDGWLQERLA